MEWVLKLEPRLNILTLDLTLDLNLAFKLKAKH